MSAQSYAKVKTVRDEDGLVVDYEIEGDFPRYGNDDDRADDIAEELLRQFLTKIKKRHTYRNSEPTTRPSSSRTVLTFAYLIALKESTV